MSHFKFSQTSKFSILEPSTIQSNNGPDKDSNDQSDDSDDSDIDSNADDCRNGESDDRVSDEKLEEIQQLFMEQIVSSSSYNYACNLSKIERKMEAYAGDITLTYGEVLLDSFRDAIMPIFTDYGGLPRGAKFYDLGSGRGRASFFVTLLANDFYHTNNHIASCTGIEIMNSLHALSLEALVRWKELYPTYLSARHGCCQSNTTTIELLLGSVTNVQCVNWSDGDLVFVNSTCFTGKTCCCSSH